MSPDRPRDTEYYRLEVAAHLVGLSVSRVRRCVRAGLVQPARVEGGFPLFGKSELARLRKIRRLLADLGLSLAAVEVVLHLLDEIAHLRAEVGREVPSVFEPSSPYVPRVLDPSRSE